MFAMRIAIRLTLARRDYSLISVLWIVSQPLSSTDFLPLWLDALAQRGEDGALDDSVCLKTLTRY